MPSLALESRMRRKLVLVIAKIGVYDPNAVKFDRHMPALSDDVNPVPFTDRFEDIVPGGDHDAVDGARETKPAPAVRDLDLHAIKSGISPGRGTQSDSAIGVVRHLEFQSQLKIGILLLGQEPTASVAATADENSFFNGP